jgi:hypothetical protein
VVQNNLNTKILSINSTTNKLEWVNKNSFVSPTPSFQDVLNINKNAYSFNGNPAFNILQGSNVTNNFGAENIIFNDETPNSNRQTWIGFDGFSSDNYNGTKQVMLTTKDGLFLKTNTSGKNATLKSTLVTGTNKVFELPNNSGTIPLSVNGNFADSSGNITVSGSSYTPPFQTFRSLINQIGPENPSQIILQNDPGYTFKWKRITDGVYVSDKITLDPQKIFFSLTLRNPKNGNNCFQNSTIFYDTAGTYQIDSFVIITPNLTAPTSCASVDDILLLSEFELLIY